MYILKLTILTITNLPNACTFLIGVKEISRFFLPKKAAASSMNAAAADIRC